MDERSSIRLGYALAHGRLSGNLLPAATSLSRCDECHAYWRMCDTAWVRRGEYVEWHCGECGAVLWRWQWRGAGE